jgi:endonuclease/exonuclease/phosphatase family metal-dependent hydrolase
MDQPGPSALLRASSGFQNAYGRNRVRHYGHYGNALLSRFRILSMENADVSSHRFERRGMLHCVVAVPGWQRNLHCVCVHLSLHERGRRRQLDALVARLEEVADRGMPIVVAGDFNDWRQRATRILEERLGLQEVSAIHGRRPARTFPSLLPVLRLDRIYVRGFKVIEASVQRGAPWSLLSDHLALGAVVQPA